MNSVEFKNAAKILYYLVFTRLKISLSQANLLIIQIKTPQGISKGT